MQIFYCDTLPFLLKYQKTIEGWTLLRSKNNTVLTSCLLQETRRSLQCLMCLRASPIHYWTGIGKRSLKLQDIQKVSALLGEEKKRSLKYHLISDCNRICLGEIRLEQLCSSWHLLVNACQHQLRALGLRSAWMAQILFLSFPQGSLFLFFTGM